MNEQFIAALEGYMIDDVEMSPAEEGFKEFGAKCTALIKRLIDKIADIILKVSRAEVYLVDKVTFGAFSKLAKTFSKAPNLNEADAVADYNNRLYVDYKVYDEEKKKSKLRSAGAAVVKVPVNFIKKILAAAKALLQKILSIFKKKSSDPESAKTANTMSKTANAVGLVVRAAEQMTAQPA